MSVLILGGDNIESIEYVLNDFGFCNITHWDGRNQKINFKKIPDNVNYLLLLTNFLNHNTMKKFKAEAKSKGIPVVCSRRGTGCVFSEMCKAMQDEKHIIHQANIANMTKLAS